MDLTEDLKRFREEWHKEVSKSNDKVKVIPGSSTSKEVNQDRARVETEVPQQGGDLSNKHFWEDDDSQGPTSNLLGSKNEVPSEIDTYFPFKIVTQFLNEAPRKISTRNKKRKGLKEEEKLSNMSYSKKKYFHDLSVVENNGKPDVSKGEPEDNKRLLDLFIADLDDINEIPFFESTLPREVAFKIFEYLDMATLGICSQVSRSWKSLADDEMLWCGICHQLGYDTDSKVFEGVGWKERIRQHLNEKRTLEANWKARVGKPYKLQFARGGVLCSVCSHRSTIVAGYTNCQVKSWNTETGEESTFTASNTALVIDETAENLGCLRNEIQHLANTDHVTAASFRHGFVDVWRNDQGVDPVHTLLFHNRDVSSLCAHDVGKQCSLVAAAQQTRIQVARVDETSGANLADIDMASPVWKMHWMDNRDGKPYLVVSCSNSVWLKEFDPSVCMNGVVLKENLSMVEVHNLIYAPISCLGVRNDLQEVGVGFNMVTGATSQVKLNLYDLNVVEPKASLIGHTWLISCMDLPGDLPYQLVTGSGDRKVRLFDLRMGKVPSLTMVGHSAKVTCVQMDDVKIVSGDEAGFVWVWDVRNGRKLWDIHNRHPVQYCRFDGPRLVIGNIPYDKFPENEGDEFESVSSLRYRGTVQFYNFLADQQRHGIPEICLSSYNEPEAYDYNLGLAVPYDALSQ